MTSKWLLVAVLFLALSFSSVRAEEDEELKVETVDSDPGAARDGSRTDSEVVGREEEAIKLDGLSVAQMKELRDKSEKHAFQVF